MVAPIRTSAFMGRQVFRGEFRGGSQQAMAEAFKASLSDLIGDLTTFFNAVSNITPAVCIEALEPTLGKSLEQVPRETGELADSAYLEVRETKKGALVEIGYGRGGNPNYAIFVHEMPYQHAAPTKNKFLQDPLEEDYFQIVNSIPRLIREAAGT